jgi:hypothetical protein
LHSTDCYVRPNATCIGWGMYYTNLLQALLSGAASDANQTLLFVTSPTWMANVSANQPLNVSWALGRQQRGALPATMRLRFRIGEQQLATVVPNAREGEKTGFLSHLYIKVIFLPR